MDLLKSSNKHNQRPWIFNQIVARFSDIKGHISRQTWDKYSDLATHSLTRRDEEPFRLPIN